jgi:NAD(P)H-dependent flavin oxidoreductase YrpB (nitropropane dioxygenase family)
LGTGEGWQPLVLGAEGINMGTRFVCTREAPVHDDLKRALVAATEKDTNLIFRTLGNTARVFRNSVSDEVVTLEQQPGGCKFEDIRHLVIGSRGRDAWMSGDSDGGVLTAGMVMGLIDDVPTCAQLIERIVRECSTRLHESLLSLNRCGGLNE